MLPRTILLLFVSVVLAIGVSGPVRAQDSKDSEAKQSPTRYPLITIRPVERFGDTAVYRIPEIVHVKFQAICESGLLTEIVESGAVVEIQFSCRSLTKDTDPKLLTIGTHIESVKPATFSPSDKVVITVQNFGIAN